MEGYRAYFAYGSNMDQEQMCYRCPEAILIGKGCVKNYRFAIDSAGVATIINQAGDTVEGVLWMVTQYDEYSLDRYEGVAYECYRRETITAKMEDGSTHNALVYISNRDEAKRTDSTGSAYMDRIVAVAGTVGLSDAYQDTLIYYAQH